MNPERDGDRIAALTEEQAEAIRKVTDAELAEWIDTSGRKMAAEKVREALKLLRPAVIQYGVSGYYAEADGVRVAIDNLTDTLEGTV